MCSAPSPGKPNPVPIRQMMALPDGGDPTLRASLLGQRKTVRSRMLMSGGASGAINNPIGMASTSNPGGA